MTFDFASLQEFLGAADLQVVVANRESANADWQATRLEIGEGDLRRHLRDVVERSVGRLARRSEDEYVDGWVLLPGYYLVAPRSDADGPLARVLLDAYSARTGALDAPTSAASTEDDDANDEPIRARVLGIVSKTSDRDLVIVRSTNPVTEMTRDKVTALIRGNRLTGARQLFAYDGGIDALFWGDSVLIANPNVFESMLRDPAVLERELTEALEVFETSQLFRGTELLAGAAQSDSNFARGLRRIYKAGYLQSLGIEPLREAVANWGHDTVRVTDNKIVFEPERRWDFLRLIDDGYLISDVTGFRYEVGSKKRWNRVEVTAVSRDGDGKLKRLYGVGSWSPRSVVDALLDIERKRTVYYVRGPEGPVRIRRRILPDGSGLWAGPDEGPNLLDDLPSSGTSS